QVEVLAEAARGGADLGTLRRRADDLVARTHVFGTLDTLEYLKKGGRIGGAQALLGTMLSIKPCVDISDGRVEEAGKQRTRRKALQWLCDTVVRHGEVEHLAVRHAEASDVDLFVSMLAEHYRWSRSMSG
ncbi:MAG: DegV family protein, partial [Acidimicrobiia bacterium]|nr:DegV family protein [Acidimicrobiia bacterium]